MLEYFTYKKIKKHEAEKRANAGVQSPILTEEDENFLGRIVSAEGTPPPLPERPNGLGMEAGDSTGNTSQMVIHDGVEQAKQDNHNHQHKHEDKGKGKGKENQKTNERDAKKSNRFSFLQRMGTKSVNPPLLQETFQY
jgi:hypothetical protein